MLKKLKNEIKQNSLLRKTVLLFYKPYLKHRLKLITWWKYGRHQKAEIDPYRIIWVNPENIQTEIRGKFHEEGYLIPRIKDGNWDKKTSDLKENEKYISIKMHFKENKEWEKTPIYQKALKTIKGEANYHDYGCTSEEELKQQFQKIEELYENISKNGFKRQKELDNKKVGKTFKKERIDYYLDDLNEMIVNIGRNGEIIFQDGYHRLSIAKILEIEKIPVRILIRHKKWQQKRNKAVENPENLDKNLLKHPDIKNTINNQK